MNFAAFQLADRNHDGRLSLQEFAESAGKFNFVFYYDVEIVIIFL